jgi:hypothetical protein
VEPTSIPILLKDDGRPLGRYILLNEIEKGHMGRFHTAEEAWADVANREIKDGWALYYEDDNEQLIREDGTARGGTLDDYFKEREFLREGPVWEASVRHWNLVCDYYAKPTAFKWLRKNLVRWYNRVHYGLKWGAADENLVRIYMPRRR